MYYFLDGVFFQLSAGLPLSFVSGGADEEPFFYLCSYLLIYSNFIKIPSRRIFEKYQDSNFNSQAAPFTRNKLLDY
jgi:hypothetical protein